MTKQTEALKLALEALAEWKEVFPDNWDAFDEQAITAIREALAEQPAQEPQPPTVAELICVCGAEWEWRNREWELVATPPAQQEPSDRFKDFPTNYWGEPIIYDTNEIDEITGFLTGDEGEEDSVTVLHNLVRYLNVVHPGKTMTQVLIETEEAALAAQQQEPFIYYRHYDGGTQDYPDEKTIPLYTSPPASKPEDK